MTHVDRSPRVPSLRFAVALALALALLAACAQLPTGRSARRPDPIRMSEVSAVGDPARRASMRLMLTGLDYDIDQSPDRALGRYERAIQVDPTNPYAYLAIARHRLEQGDPEGALSFLDQSEALLHSEGDVSPRVAVHLTGLRGWALWEGGDLDVGRILLSEASEQAPDTWRDGQLSARELR